MTIAALGNPSLPLPWEGIAQGYGLTYCGIIIKKRKLLRVKGSINYRC
jgi:hypothetical protein